MERKKIIVIDAIIMSFFSYLYISQLPTGPTLFQKVVFTAIVFMAVMFLMRFPLVGKVLQFWATIVWVMVLMIIVPFGDLTNDNPFLMAGIVVVLFLIFLSLHGTLVQDAYGVLKKLKKKKRMAEHKYGEEDVVKYEEGMLRQILNISNYECIENYNSFTMQYYFVCSKDSDKILEVRLFPETDRIGKVFQVIEISIRDMYGEVLNKVDNRIGYADFTQKLNQLEKDFKFSSICRKYKKWEWAWLYICKVRGFSSKNSDNEADQMKNTKNEDDIDLELFNGCDDMESITYRYRQLMKMYHPDNKNGDSKMTTKIRMTYDAIKEKY